MAKWTDERIIQAIANNGSIRAASRELKCSPATIYTRMKQDGFKEKVDAVRDSALHEASAQLSGSMTDAIKVLVDIMNDKDTAPQTRANAAAQILSYALRYSETAEILRRLEQVEQREGISNEKHS